MIQPSDAPLTGLKVIDVSRVLAGPYCAQMLGDYGADVIKIEPPAGDLGRASGPPFVNGESVMVAGVNRNKRGVALDLTHPDGREVLRKLLADADVLVENFKPGTMERWGLGWDDLKEAFPRLIMVSITGFGTTGPLGGSPGFDGTAAAWSGVIAANGEPDGDPLRLGVSIVDMSTGLHATIGVLLAVQARARTGRGQHLDIALFDCALPLLQPHVPNWLQAHARTPRSGNMNPTFTPMGLFPTADDPIYLAVSSDRHFASLCEVIGRPAWATDPRFGTLAARAANRVALIALVTEAFSTESAKDLALRLNAADIPAGAVLNVADTLEHPHTAHRDMVVDVAGFRSLGIPIKLSDTPGAVRRRPPAFGEHTHEILEELGLADEEIDALRERGVAPRERVR